MKKINIQTLFSFLLMTSIFQIGCIKKVDNFSRDNWQFQYIENEYLDDCIITSDTTIGILLCKSDGTGFQKNSWADKPTPIHWDVKESTFVISFDEDDVYSFQIVKENLSFKEMKQISMSGIKSQIHQHESTLILK